MKVTHREYFVDLLGRSLKQANSCYGWASIALSLAAALIGRHFTEDKDVNIVLTTMIPISLLVFVAIAQFLYFAAKDKYFEVEKARENEVASHIKSANEREEKCEKSIRELHDKIDSLKRMLDLRGDVDSTNSVSQQA